MRFTKQIVGAAGLACLTAMPLAARQAAPVGGGQPAQTPAQAPPRTPGQKPLGSGPKTGGTGAQATSSAGSLSSADRTFVLEAAVGGMAEVELGRLAADKASSPDVKQFGQRMVDDHGKANMELMAFASQKNITAPTALDAKHKATSDRLAKLSGAAFDRAYMRDMVADHNEDVAAFTHTSTSASDPDLKAWAAKTLPTLKEHQRMAKAINAKLAPTGVAPKT